MVETFQQPQLIPKHLTSADVLNCEGWANPPPTGDAVSTEPHRYSDAF